MCKKTNFVISQNVNSQDKGFKIKIFEGLNNLFELRCTDFAVKLHYSSESVGKKQLGFGFYCKQLHLNVSHTPSGYIERNANFALQY